MDSCYPVLRHGLIRLLLLPPPFQRCSAKSFNKLVSAKNCNANKPTPGQGGISFGKMFLCVCVFYFFCFVCLTGWFCWQNIMWIGLSSVSFFGQKLIRFFPVWLRVGTSIFMCYGPSLIILDGKNQRKVRLARLFLKLSMFV